MAADRRKPIDPYPADRRKPIDPYPEPGEAFEFWGAPVYTNSDGTLYCSGYYGNTFPFNSWDRVLIPSIWDLNNQGACLPGLASVTLPGGGKKRDVDKKKAAGNDGARHTIHGVDAADVMISLLIWTPEQLRELNRIWPILFPLSGKKQPEAFDVSHPLLKLHGIKSVQFVGGDGPNPGPRQGTRIFEMKAAEYQPPGKKNTTVTVVKAKGSLLDPPEYPSPGTNPANTDP